LNCISLIILCYYLQNAKVWFYLMNWKLDELENLKNPLLTLLI
jgi:hypothetical protein